MENSKNQFEGVKIHKKDNGEMVMVNKRKKIKMTDEQKKLNKKIKKKFKK